MISVHREGGLVVVCVDSLGVDVVVEGIYYNGDGGIHDADQRDFSLNDCTVVCDCDRCGVWEFMFM